MASSTGSPSLLSRTLPTWLLAVVATFATGHSAAQDAFPSKPVRVIVPWPPGGPPDLFARIITPRMGEQWGRAVVVENRPGATGTIGTDLVAKSAPDGYTLLITSNQPLVIAPALIRVPYDPVKDLAPVAQIGEGVISMVVSPSLGVKTPAELIALAKSKPGGLTYATSGIGSLGHLAGELVGLIGGTAMVHVPFQGAAQAVTSVVTGEVAVGFPPITQVVPLARSGKLLVLGVAGQRPSQFMPEVPTLVSQGLNGVVASSWVAAMVAPKTPRPLINTLRDGLQKVVQDPGMRQKLYDAGIEVQWQEADVLSQVIEADLARWRKVVAAAKISAN